jgi:hypothetical protein
MTIGTNQQYDTVTEQCATLFLQKTADYGTSWRVLRTISVVDQIYIKAWRIRNIQETGKQKIADGIEGEFVGIINYSIIGLIQLHLKDDEKEELDPKEAETLYNQYLNGARELMLQKNHDYGEAWRMLSQESFVDLILMKLQRMRQIISNGGRTVVSEGLDANYYDMINYAVFALILKGEGESL